MANNIGELIILSLAGRAACEEGEIELEKTAREALANKVAINLQR